MNLMSKFDDHDIQTIADEIIRYLRVHENAADTLEGVQGWWLTIQRIEESKQKVAAALDYLCKHDLITARNIAGGKTIFALNKDTMKGQK